MPTDAELQTLLDKQAISEVIGSRYGRALDWLDFDALKDCFWSDGWVDYGFFVDNAHEWCDVVAPIESGSDHRVHYTFGILVDVNGDTAEAESNSLAGGRRTAADGEATQSFYGSRYLDTLEKREGIWRISKRRVLLEFAQTLPAGGAPGDGLKGLALVSGLGPDHEFYRRMPP